MVQFNPDIFQKRLQKYALNCLQLVKSLPNSESNKIYGKQLIRSSSSPGANYIEALEAESKRDFIHRLRICRKETKESIYWLELIISSNNQVTLTKICEPLTVEGREFIKIFSSSILTTETKLKMKKNDSINRK